MIQYVLKKNINEKMPNAYGKFFAYPVITQTYDIDQLVDHMASHNTPFSRGAIKGMITDMVACIRELVLQGIAVKIADLAILYTWQHHSSNQPYKDICSSCPLLLSSQPLKKVSNIQGL